MLLLTIAVLGIWPLGECDPDAWHPSLFGISNPCGTVQTETPPGDTNDSDDADTDDRDESSAPAAPSLWERLWAIAPRAPIQVPVDSNAEPRTVEYSIGDAEDSASISFTFPGSSEVEVLQTGNDNTFHAVQLASEFGMAYEIRVDSRDPTATKDDLDVLLQGHIDGMESKYPSYTHTWVTSLHAERRSRRNLEDMDASVQVYKARMKWVNKEHEEALRNNEDFVASSQDSERDIKHAWVAADTCVDQTFYFVVTDSSVISVATYEVLNLAEELPRSAQHGLTYTPAYVEQEYVFHPDAQLSQLSLEQAAD